MTDQPPITASVPAPPPDVNHVDLWYKVGEVNAKLDSLIEAMPKAEERLRSLERSRTQVYTAASIVTAAAGTLAAYGKKIVELVS
jgi:hypothetical protein